MTKIHQFAIMCAPTTSQLAAIEALRSCDDEVERMAALYDMRRRLMVNAFNSMGLHCFNGRGAFYVFPWSNRPGFLPMASASASSPPKRWRSCPGPLSAKAAKASSAYLIPIPWNT